MTQTLSARQQVIRDAFPDDEKLQAVTSHEATYVGNHVGGRPSDSARSAVVWVRRAVEARDACVLASPTAQAVMTEWLEANA